MKNALKRSLSVLLAITIIFSSAYVGLGEVDFSGLFAIKAEAASVDDLTFTLNEDGKSYSVTDCDTSASGELVIPNTYDGLPVTNVGDSAFQLCESLTSITVPDGVISIGSTAFHTCTNLASVILPDSITSIGVNAFFKTIISRDSSNWKDGILYLGNHLIEASDSISGDYKIKSGTKTIAQLAFAGCNRLNSITIPDSVTNMGSGVFSNCSNLKSVILSNSITSIDSLAFNECTSLKSITIPDSVTSIGTNAFFYCTSLVSIILPDSITSIGSSAFESCYSLTSLTIPNNLKNIGYEVFYYCTNLSSITIPDSVKSIFWYRRTMELY